MSSMNETFMTMSTPMINILLISAIVYLLCCHKVSFDFRMWIYKQAYIAIWSSNTNIKTSVEEAKDGGVVYKIEKRNWFMPLIYEWFTCYFCAGFWIGAIYFLCKVAPHSPLGYWILAWHMIRFSLVCAIVSNVCCNATQVAQNQR